MRTLCDSNPTALTRWLFERERDGRYTGLIMVWPPGYSTPIHDHDGLWGIEWVLQGALSVDDFALVDDGDGHAQPRFIGTTILEEGAILRIPRHARARASLQQSFGSAAGDHAASLRRPARDVPQLRKHARRTLRRAAEHRRHRRAHRRGVVALHSAAQSLVSAQDFRSTTCVTIGGSPDTRNRFA